MRIRTIKPEFWSHPVMARLPDDIQLLALSLISMADDHGYFRADPSIVRGTVMPFREDLATISRSLAKLSEVGWIELSEHPEQGTIGRITKWFDHQKVDHPKDSHLMVYFSRETIERDSREPRENLARDSREPRESLALDQGRDQGREGKGGEAAAVLPKAPSLSEVIEYGGMIGVTDKTCRAFVKWHNDNNAWLWNGKLIQWRKKLVDWAVRDRESANVKSEIQDTRPVWVREGYIP